MSLEQLGILDAIEESAREMSQAAPGSDERIRGVTLLGLVREHRELRAAIIEYAGHQSWRCEHVDRFWSDGHCPCGLTRTLDRFDIERTA